VAAVARDVEVQPIGATFGARISGLDLRDLNTESFDWLRDQFSRSALLVCSGQDMTPDEQVAFASRWGPISRHPYVKPLEGYPDILEVVDPANPIAQNWHQDQTYLEHPPAMTMLLARVLPPAGGDTMFADQHAAFEQLSPGMRQTLRSLRAVHRGTELAAEAGLERVEVERIHPVVIRHPVTGREALFVNTDYTIGIDGWSLGESEAVLDFLYRWSTRPEISCRHVWSPGDFVLWDNLSLVHRVVANAQGPRLLHKVTIATVV
jgi:taurine dioxygenase